MAFSTAGLLIFTPTWVDEATGEDVIRPEVEAAIKNQVGVDFDWHVTSENPHPIGDYRNVLHQYQRAREWFLHSKQYDALLTIEHDNRLPDENAVARLLDTPGDVVYAPYMLRHGTRLISTWQYINDFNLGMSLSNYPEELQRARDKTIWRVSGAGFGCTLIRRNVLEAIEFTGATDQDQNECPDLRFAEDCLRKHFIANGRFDVPVEHWNGNGWLHPVQDRSQGVGTYVAVETVRSFAAGRIVQLTQGCEIELSDDEAFELSRCGYITSAPNIAPTQIIAPLAEAPILAPAQEIESVPPTRRNRAKTLTPKVKA